MRRTEEVTAHAGGREKAPKRLRALSAERAAKCIREQAGGNQYPRPAGTVIGRRARKTEWNRGRISPPSLFGDGGFFGPRGAPRAAGGKAEASGAAEVF
ncbi:MAG TPA: hypothetical protein DDW99_05525 [Ruminococcaceae bacterium]|nr:hypothetical protein [Oscillospiraceae bacterium]HBQ45843.1 hypothetical protein [Oscillospiraceae bacterium]